MVMRSPLLMLACTVAAVPATAQDLAKRGGGDTIGNGRPVACLFHTPPRERCTFYPRNGNGSFVLKRGNGRLYYATRTGPDTMRFSVSDGRDSVDVGGYARSRDDRACWVRRPDRRICAW